MLRSVRTNLLILFKKLQRYFYTLLYLKPHQIYLRLSFNYIKQRVVFLEHPKLASPKSEWKETLIKKNIYSNGAFTFLNETHHFNEIEWNSKNISKLWMYNLHYFDYLLLNKENNFSDQALINNWISQNSTYSIGWDSYPTSLRIVNWIKFYLGGNTLDKNFLDSLYTQANWLSKRIEYHIEGNHLFANGKALIFAGVFFNSSESKNLKQLGLKIIKAEVKKQILYDGGHFELSPMYHSIIVEDILDIIHLADIYPGSMDESFLDSLKNTASKMISWLDIMTHPDGSLSFFNDSVNNISRSFKEIIDYASTLNLPQERNFENFIELKDSGYNAYEANDYKILIDTANVGADFQPGHGHADTLSFEASVLKKKLIVNLGVSAYQGSDLRLKERGTESHSSLMIDGINSSDVWGEFRVGRRAKIIAKEISFNDEFIKIAASHDGYKYLKGCPIHQRKFYLYEKKFEIVDVLSGTGHHAIKVFFHLHPETKVIKSDKSEVTLFHHGLPIDFNSNFIEFLSLKEFSYSPEFGLNIPSKSLVLEYNCDFPCEIKSSFSW